MDDMNNLPGHLARRFQQIAVAVFHAEVGAVGSDLTPVQFAAMVKVRANAGVDQATLAGLIAYDRATIGGVIDRLVDKGLVTRNPSPRDRRAKELRLTEAGLALIAHVEPAVLAAQEALLSGLEESEKTEFMRLLAKATEGANALSRAPIRNEKDK
ncbi:MarR family transcriptional regulator [Rhizobium sp. L1K21]|nr:MarR family transcriptional regulator [Rhizobium sp. L1K21]